MHIRDADERDAAGIAEIYTDAILHSTASWHTAPVDAAERRAWLAAQRRQGFPVLVAAGDDDEVLGFADYARWRPWAGYRHTAEHSVYVRADRRGEGLGGALMTALIDRARDCGVHVLVAGVDAGNTGSIRLHERLGFAEVGRLPQVGAKFGRWLDLVFLQKTLDRRPSPPPS